MREALARLFGDTSADLYLPRFESLFASEASEDRVRSPSNASMLLAYPGHITNPGQSSLAALKDFLDSAKLPFTNLHILPPFVSTGDFGFAPAEHLEIEDRYGDWKDLASLSGSFDLSIDLILNHVSPEHPWFQGYLRGEPEFEDFFMEVAEATDFTAVARSRHHPPTTQFSSRTGSKLLWTRYGPGQVDLNYRNPEVLLAMASLLREYGSRGMVGVRLDALAFTWKDPSSSSSNLPEVFDILRVLRTVADHIPDPVFLIAESDVKGGASPYVADDLAHMAYRYESAPIITHAVISGDAGPLNTWLEELREIQTPALGLNFLGTHDGMFLRGYDPPLCENDLQELTDAAVRQGGHVSYREIDGTRRAYELNITTHDLLGGEADDPERCLLAALFLVHVVPGIPMVYLSHILGSQNDHAAVEATEDLRAINRKPTSLKDALQIDRLRDGSLIARYKRLLAVHGALDCFSSNAPLVAGPSFGSSVVSLSRTGESDSALCLLSLSENMQEISLGGRFRELLSNAQCGPVLTLEPMTPMILVEETSDER